MKFAFQGRTDRPAAFMAEYDEQRRMQMRSCVLQAARDFWRQDIPGYTNDEEFSQTRVKDYFGWNPRVTATEYRSVRLLPLRQTCKRLRCNTQKTSLATEKAFIAIHEALHCFVGRNTNRLWLRHALFVVMGGESVI